MTNPYMTQLLAQARIDAMRTAGAARAGGVYVVTRDRRPGRIRAWVDAQLRRPRHRAPRPALTGGQVATCSR
jgi:hypothetical protein